MPIYRWRASKPLLGVVHSQLHIVETEASVSRPFLPTPNFRERRYSVVRVVLNFSATSKTLHIYPSMLQGVWTGPQPRPTTAYFQAHRTGAMHDPAYELPRRAIPRTRVNKGPGLQKSSALMSATQLSSLCLGGHPRQGSGTNWPRNARAEGVSSR